MARKIFSFLFAFLFVPLFIIFLVLLNLKLTILSPVFYKSVLNETNIYTEIIAQAPNIIQEQMASQQGKEGEGGAVSQQAIPQDFLEIAQKSISADWIKSQAEKIIDGVFDFANGKTKTLDITISLVEFKQTFITKFVAGVKEKGQALPQCTAEQTQKLQTEGQTSFLPECLPQGINVDESISQLTTQLQKGLNDSIPNEFVFGKDFGDLHNLEVIQLAFQIFQIVLYSLLGISLLLLLFLFLLNKRKENKGLAWMAVPILIASTIVLLLIFAGFFIFLVSSGLWLNQLSATLSPLVQKLVSIASTKLVFSFVLTAGSAFLLSIILLILAHIIKKKYRKNEKQKTQRTE